MVLWGNRCNSEQFENLAFHLHTEEATGSIPVSPTIHIPTVPTPLPPCNRSIYLDILRQPAARALNWTESSA